MVDYLSVIIAALKGHIRVNRATKSVEIFNEYGTKMVLRDLTDLQLEAFASEYQEF